jgi:hypothetical protein
MTFRFSHIALVCLFVLGSMGQGRQAEAGKLLKKLKKAKKSATKTYRKAKRKVFEAQEKAKNAVYKPDNKLMKLLPAERKRLKKRKAWFKRLPTIRWQALRPGDVLLKKDYRDGKKTSPVIDAQTAFRAKKATKYTVHAMLYMGNGQIIEASNYKQGVWYGKLSEYSSPEKMRLIVYRPTNRRAIEGALRVAKAFASSGWKSNGTKKPKVSYSLHGIDSMIRSSKFGSQAKKQAKDVSKLKRPKNVMCSEFIVLCFQYKTTTIRLHARHTAPIRLEEYLNTKGKKSFRFLGRLAW